jgi:hypothetical protein
LTTRSLRAVSSRIPSRAAERNIPSSDEGSAVAARLTCVACATDDDPSRSFASVAGSAATRDAVAKASRACHSEQPDTFASHCSGVAACDRDRHAFASTVRRASNTFAAAPRRSISALTSTRRAAPRVRRGIHRGDDVAQLRSDPVQRVHDPKYEEGV